MNPVKRHLVGFVICLVLAVAAVGQSGRWESAAFVAVGFYLVTPFLGWLGPRFASWRLRFDVWRVRRQIGAEK